MTRISVLAAIVVAVLAADGVRAAQGRNDRYPDPVDRSGSTKARKNVAEAEADLAKAQAEFSTIRGTLRKDLENGAEWRGAQTTLKQAQADYEAARGAVMKNLRENAEYKAAKQRKEQAEAARDAVTDPPGSAKHVEAASAVLEAGKTLTDLETAAINADPKASEAKRLLKEAADKVAAINKQFEETMEQNPKYRSAQKAVDDGKKKVASGQAALASALQKEAAAERDRQSRIDEIEKRRAQDERRRALQEERRRAEEARRRMLRN